MFKPPETTDLGNESPAIVLPEGSIDHSHCGDLKFPKQGECPAPAKHAGKNSAKVAAKPSVEPVIKEPSMIPETAVVGIGKMVNAKGNVVTDIMVARVDKHMKYLNNEVGFKSIEEAHEEQIAFMETIANSLKLDFDAYVVVTDHLLKAVRANQKVFSEGLAFRFMANLEKKYPAEYIRSYQAYMELLGKIGSYWTVRFKLAKLIDLASVIANLDPKAKTNVTQYFRKLSAV